MQGITIWMLFLAIGMPDLIIGAPIAPACKLWNIVRITMCKMYYYTDVVLIMV